MNVYLVLYFTFLTHRSLSRFSDHYGDGGCDRTQPFLTSTSLKQKLQNQPNGVTPRDSSDNHSDVNRSRTNVSST